MLVAKIFVVIAISIMVGCASIEEGEIDYARTLAGSSTSTESGDLCDEGAYILSIQVPAGFTRQCYETLYRKYTSAPDIKKGDTIAVNLMQAYIEGAKEWRTPSEVLMRQGANAEIVVIANVCEQGKTGCSQQFGPSADKKGRVVYFSNGVKAKQYLNFSFLPVYGPIKYEGGPLIVQLTIMDFDDLTEQELGMLETLSGLGKKAYPPASKALSILESIGTGLLERGSDDILFRYSMTLIPGGADAGYQSPVVSAGNYAFIRKDTVKGPQEEEVWRALKFDNLSGRLVRQCQKEDEYMLQTDRKGNVYKNYDYQYCKYELNSGQKYRDYRKNSYLTFQIQSGLTEAALDEMQTLEELLIDISTQKDKSATELIEKTEKLGEELARDRNERTLIHYINELIKSTQNINTDNLNQFLLTANSFLDRYGKMVTEFNVHCTGNGKPDDKCDKILTKEQLDNVFYQTRKLLNIVNPTVDASTLVPESIIDTGKFANLRGPIFSALKQGYQYQTNQSIYSQYLGGFNTIENLARYASQLNVEINDGDTSKKIRRLKEKELKTVEKLLRRNMKAYLTHMGKDLMYYKLSKCNSSSIYTSQCYRYFSQGQLNELANILNFYINSNKKSNASYSLIVNNLVTHGLPPSEINTIINLF